MSNEDETDRSNLIDLDAQRARSAGTAAPGGEVGDAARYNLDPERFLDLYDRAGYFNLSNKNGTDFMGEREDYVRAFRLFQGHGELACQAACVGQNRNGEPRVD